MGCGRYLHVNACIRFSKVCNVGKLTETQRPLTKNSELGESDPVQQNSQRPRAAEGSDPDNEITEKKDYNQREETGRRWAYEKLEPWSEWIPGNTQMSMSLRSTNCSSSQRHNAQRFSETLSIESSFQCAYRICQEMLALQPTS